jgi:hypothetical protein
VASLLPAGAAAQDVSLQLPGAAEPVASFKEGKLIHAFQIVGNAPKIDGVLDDEVWRAAEIGEHFIQWDPDNMQPLSERTRMQVAYDARYIYVAVRCDDRTPDRIASGLGRRDEFPPTDTVGIGFDPRHDHQTGYVFQTNPSGVQQDVFFFDDDKSDRDFDAVWEVRTAITPDGWVAEFRIPFSQMRFTAAAAPGQVWGFGARRQIRRRSELGEWTGKPRGERGEVSRWGHLVFDAPLKPPRRIELQPYALASGAHAAASAGDLRARTGADLRVGLGSSATLAATVNPDFGQVEQDPAVLNLTILETFFPEKRPFFLEDSRTFVPPYGLFQLFHSRRIGRKPDRITIASDQTVIDKPTYTTILGAAKLTGKGSGWTYGALSAVTGREHATVRATGGTGLTPAPSFETLIEPMTSYNVVRLQHDIWNGSSNIGAVATGVVREKDADAFAGSVDYNLRWDRNRVNWNGQWALTRAPVSGAMQTGAGGVTNVNVTRKHGSVFSHFDHFDRAFRVDDLGFFRARANRTALEGGFSLEQPDPWKAFRRMSLFVYAGQAWNDERLLFSRYVGPSVSAQFRNFWTIETGVNREFRALDDLDTRGGPPIVSPAKTGGFFFFSSDSRQNWRLSVFGNWQRDEAGGWNARIGPGLSLQPSGRLQASLSTTYTFAKDIAQWIKNLDTDGDGVTDYVYGTLGRDVVDVTLRSTYAMHRDLTLQVFLQPFVAVGAYTDIRRLARPRSFEFEPVTLADNPDFNRKSLRGNVVLRWEYLRGSTIYVAWNLATSDTSRPGVFRALRDLGDAFGAEGTHAVVVKVSYWLGR